MPPAPSGPTTSYGPRIARSQRHRRDGSATKPKCGVRCAKSDLRKCAWKFVLLFFDRPIEIRVHGFLDGREERVLLEAREQPEAAQLVLDRVLHLGEVELD